MTEVSSLEATKRYSTGCIPLVIVATDYNTDYKQRLTNTVTVAINLKGY